MYSNLEAEISRRKIPKYLLAEKIGISISTLYQKLSGKSNFTLPEAKKIKEVLGADDSIEYLFSNNEQRNKPA